MRTLPCLVAGAFLVLLLAAFPAARGGAAAHPPAAVNTALEHWIYDASGRNATEVRKLADDLLAHAQQVHPGATFMFYRELVEVQGNFLHVLLETPDSTAQQDYISAHTRGSACAALLAREGELAMQHDLNMRLIASDPAKEAGLGQFGGAIVWTFETHFFRIGQARECVRKLVEHLNANYPDDAFRGYDEWYPQSGRLRIYAFGTGIAAWERAEARMREDPVVRGLMEGAAEAFVPGGFDDTWLGIITR
jgi:hypothetical protein